MVSALIPEGIVRLGRLNYEAPINRRVKAPRYALIDERFKDR